MSPHTYKYNIGSLVKAKWCKRADSLFHKEITGIITKQRYIVQGMQYVDGTHGPNKKISQYLIYNIKTMDCDYLYYTDNDIEVLS